LRDDVLVALAGGNYLVDPAGKRMGAGGGDLQPGTFGGGYEFTAGAVHFDAQVADGVADARAGFHDGLVHLALNLLEDVRGSGGDQLHDVGAQFARLGIDDLKLFFYTDGEAVSHGAALRSGLGSNSGTGSDIIPF